MAECDNCAGCPDDAVIHRLCDECVQEQVDADDVRHAEKDAEIAKLRADNARLRAAMPTEEERYCLDCILGADAIRDGHDAYLTEVEGWLARVEAAKGGA